MSDKLWTLVLCTGTCIVVALPGALLFYLVGAEIRRFIGESIVRGVSVILGMAVVGALLAIAIGLILCKIEDRKK